jgi:hypothetical protein
LENSGLSIPQALAAGATGNVGAKIPANARNRARARQRTSQSLTLAPARELFFGQL